MACLEMGGCLAGLLIDKSAEALQKNEEYKRAVKGRTPQQKQVIDYFYMKGGCLNKTITDQEYDAMVMERIGREDFKQKALNRLGIDESEVQEIAPVHFESYYFDANGKTSSRLGKDHVWRSSGYQVTWLFFSDTQVYIYQYTLNMDEDGQKERTEEYFYRDVTNFSSAAETEEQIVADKVSCTGKTSYIRKNITYDSMSVIVPGDKFSCAMTRNDYSEKAIQGMKAKLREKKNQR